MYNNTAYLQLLQTVNINKEKKLKFAKINPELKYKIFLSTTTCSTFILQGSIFADGACSANISSSKKKKHTKLKTAKFTAINKIKNGFLKELRHDILSRFQIEKFSLNFSIWLFVIRVNLRHP